MRYSTSLIGPVPITQLHVFHLLSFLWIHILSATESICLSLYICIVCKANIWKISKGGISTVTWCVAAESGVLIVRRAGPYIITLSPLNTMLRHWSLWCVRYCSHIVRVTWEEKDYCMIYSIKFNAVPGIAVYLSFCTYSLVILSSYNNSRAIRRFSILRTNRITWM